MLNKTLIVISFILLTQKVCPIYSKTLPTNNNDADVDRTNGTTSYYRHNIFGANTYAFGFEINDKASGNIQFRDERRYANGTIQGSYGYVRPDGTMMVTHYLADTELGYLSQSQNVAPGEQPKWQENLPIKKLNNILMEKSLESMELESVIDDKEQLNLTSILLPVEPIKEEHGIDLNPPELEKELVNPAVLEVINGEAPLTNDPKKKNNSIGFETINKFIPAEFPIVPFQLPSENIKINLNEGMGETAIPVLNKTNDSGTENLKKSLPLPANDSTADEKHMKSQGNSTQQALPSASTITLNESNSNISPAAKSIIIDKNTDWYDKVINQTRQEYLETVH